MFFLWIPLNGLQKSRSASGVISSERTASLPYGSDTGNSSDTRTHDANLNKVESGVVSQNDRKVDVGK